ncbi:PTS system cellobiose-specific IIB component [Hypnocyclicus thermotrophus]|uniref:PTS system cellobiose-specific IIB component n=1 Tax=Hypnocyclicus thermotrophus TaxID=1627895 RepID=A0AA46E0N5_9FUSO|nr:PTS sugar transporter subunit IIB [Hypnocyclicus thermotrophus]TDT72480.1 PTS system cellobiose-specific IIB component [Hypnocyclicus thermotrophus]
MKKILLLCSAGMSTSIVVRKMKQEADKRGLEIEIDALGLENFHDKLNEYDVFLLGPQVRFKKNELTEIAKKHNKVVEVIDSRDYGTLNGAKILDFALSL